MEAMGASWFDAPGAESASPGRLLCHQVTGRLASGLGRDPPLPSEVREDGHERDDIFIYAFPIGRLHYHLIHIHNGDHLPHNGRGR